MSENGADVIVKVVNPTDEPATLRIKVDWASISNTEFEYYAPGSLGVANSMENKKADSLQKAAGKLDGNDVILSIPALSAGVLTISKGF